MRSAYPARIDLTHTLMLAQTTRVVTSTRRWLRGSQTSTLAISGGCLPPPLPPTLPPSPPDPLPPSLPPSLPHRARAAGVNGVSIKLEHINTRARLQPRRQYDTPLRRDPIVRKVQHLTTNHQLSLFQLQIHHAHTLSLARAHALFPLQNHRKCPLFQMQMRCNNKRTHNQMIMTHGKNDLKR
jgi:hypothetical protein